jgi:hypothetical protein
VVLKSGGKDVAAMDRRKFVRLVSVTATAGAPVSFTDSFLLSEFSGDLYR